MKTFKLYLCLVVLAASLLCVGCSQEQDPIARERGIYYWNTTFSLDSAKLDFISRHNIDRLYVRYFDVVDNGDRPVPNATINFDSVVSAPCEIVPVAFILNDCMKSLSPEAGKDLAQKMLARILQMNETHDIGQVKEIQIDCDWTVSTRAAYFRFLEDFVAECRKYDIAVSSTIRLHQLSQVPPPVDRGTLMVYNTGDLTNYDETKPILDEKVVEQYVRYLKDYKLPLTTAYPIYKWDIVFRNGRFVDILHYPDEIPVLQSDEVVKRIVKPEEILHSKELVSSHLVDGGHGTILFDLNDYNITRYTDEEFESFFD